MTPTSGTARPQVEVDDDWLPAWLRPRPVNLAPIRQKAVRALKAFGITRMELAGVAACTLAFTLWNAMARDALVLGVAKFFAVFFLACLLAGRLFARMLPQSAERDLPTVLAIGFLLLNTALYVLALCSPLSIVTNAYILLFAVLAAHIVSAVRGCYRGNPSREAGGSTGASGVAGTESPTDERVLGLLTLAVSLVAAMFWSWDSIAPQLLFREGILLKPFFDSFFHASEIRMFRDAQGASTLADLRMAGEPVWIYHHASYLASALVSAWTGTTAYLTFGSFYVTSGVLMSGLAAHALIRSLWGPGAGLAATTALLLLPSPARHGLHNYWLSYRWLQQVAPGGYFGTAVLAIAWLLMFAGCRTGRVRLVVLGFVAAGLSAHYKAHLFVANALLIWLYPGVFLRRVAWRRKLAWFAFALGSFLTVAWLAQHSAEVPTMRLDCSSVKNYMNATVAWCEYEDMKRYFRMCFTPTSSLRHDLAWGAAVLFYGSLGLMGVANVALALFAAVWRRDERGNRRVELEYLVFPLVIILNYLVMSLALAYDPKRPTHADELRHRPLVWAYFVTAIWAGALTYRLFLERAAARSPQLRGALLGLILLLLAVPYKLGPNIQAPTQQWRPYSFQSYPRGLYESARFIRENAYPGEVVQESSQDPLFVFSALCEHPAYAIAYFDGREDPVLSARIKELEAFKRMTDADAIRQFAKQRRIRYYVLHPDTKVRWPQEILARPDFCWGGIRVYSFFHTFRPS